MGRKYFLKKRNLMIIRIISIGNKLNLSESKSIEYFIKQLPKNLQVEFINLKGQQNYSEQIFTEIERYRNLVDSSCDYNDKNGFCHILVQDFIKNTSDFSHLYSCLLYTSDAADE